MAKPLPRGFVATSPVRFSWKCLLQHPQEEISSQALWLVPFLFDRRFSLGGDSNTETVRPYRNCGSLHQGRFYAVRLLTQDLLEESPRIFESWVHCWRVDSRVVLVLILYHTPYMKAKKIYVHPYAPYAYSGAYIVVYTSILPIYTYMPSWRPKIYTYIDTHVGVNGWRNALYSAIGIVVLYSALMAVRTS